jgi:hypothetical protein
MSVHAVDERRWAEITGKFPPERYCNWREFKDQTPSSVFFRRGVDFGESLEHFFACVWGWKNGNGDWFVFDEYLDNIDIMYDHRIGEVKDRYPWPDKDPHFGLTYCDTSRPGYISLMGRHNISCAGAIKDREAGFETIRKLLPVRDTINAMGKPDKLPRLIILKERCPVLCKQIWKLRYMRSTKPGATDTRLNKKKAPNEPQDWDNDSVDACRYMIHSDTPYDGSPPSTASTTDDPSRYGLNIKGRIKDRIR